MDQWSRLVCLHVAGFQLAGGLMLLGQSGSCVGEEGSTGCFHQSHGFFPGSCGGSPYCLPSITLPVWSIYMVLLGAVRHWPIQQAATLPGLFFCRRGGGSPWIGWQLSGAGTFKAMASMVRGSSPANPAFFSGFGRSPGQYFFGVGTGIPRLVAFWLFPGSMLRHFQSRLNVAVSPFREQAGADPGFFQRQCVRHISCSFSAGNLDAVLARGFHFACSRQGFDCVNFFATF